MAHLGEEYFIVGCVHDLVEDGEATLLEIRQLFGDTVRDAVDSVTRRAGEVYMDFIRRAKLNPIGREVKLADNDENSKPERIATLPPEERDILKRYKKARAILLS